MTAPLFGGSITTLVGEEVPTGALIYRTFSNRGVLAWSLAAPQFGKTNRYWEPAAFTKALEILADEAAPRRTVVVLLSGGWSHAFHYHAQIAGARYLSRRPAARSGSVGGDTWLEIGNTRVETITLAPHRVSPGAAIRYRGRRRDLGAWQQGLPRRGVAAEDAARPVARSADAFDPNFRVFRVTSS